MKLGAWLDHDTAVARLIDRGMSSQCAAAAAPCFEAAARMLVGNRCTNDDEAAACWAPGRIEVLGKHTDYCGGASILAAAERGFCMLAVPRGDAVVRMLDARTNESCEFPIDTNLERTVGHWSNYPQTVVRRLAKNFPEARRGATIAFASNLPPASGMSSSSAFMIATFNALTELNQLSQSERYTNSIRSREDLAGYLSTVENGLSFGPLAGDRGVGTFGGSEDHTAILCGQPNRLVQYAYCPVRFVRSIELSDDYVFAIASSGVVAEKTGAALEKYNRVSKLAAAIVELWRGETGETPTSLAEIVDSVPNAAARLQDSIARAKNLPFADVELAERLEHFLVESKAVNATPQSINRETVKEFGLSVQVSQESGVRLLKNQTPETIRLAQIAIELGAHAASAFGAGFGGSIWALLERNKADALISAWRAKYAQEFPEPSTRADFFVSRPGTSAFVDATK
jgi:galactokinase